MSSKRGQRVLTPAERKRPPAKRWSNYAGIYFLRTSTEHLPHLSSGSLASSPAGKSPYCLAFMSHSATHLFFDSQSPTMWNLFGRVDSSSVNGDNDCVRR